jgi:XapX domain-containing protein
LKDYIAALAAGTLVGVIYGLINVRSPAPPIVGLVGLLGILLGEQAVPLGQATANLALRHDLVAKRGVSTARVREAAGRPHLGTGVRGQEGGVSRVTWELLRRHVRNRLKGTIGRWGPLRVMDWP